MCWTGGSVANGSPVLVPHLLILNLGLASHQKRKKKVQACSVTATRAILVLVARLISYSLTFNSSLQPRTIPILQRVFLHV